MVLGLPPLAQLPDLAACPREAFLADRRRVWKGRRPAHLGLQWVVVPSRDRPPDSTPR